MSRRRELERRLRSLGEIDKILGSMRNLAYMELRKLAQFRSGQRRAVAAIEAAAADLLAFHPELAAGPERTAAVLLVLGSERGFCGDFNQRLQQACADFAAARGEDAEPRIVAVGRKLGAVMEGDPRVAARLDGAGVAEEVYHVMVVLIDTLRRLGAELGPLTLTALYHDPESHGVQAVPVLPPFQRPSAPAPSGHAPRTYVPPPALFQRLVDPYLFAVLTHLFYSALTAEQEARVAHLEGTHTHLQTQMSALQLRRNTVRQEEITEEIEVILLGAE